MMSILAWIGRLLWSLFFTPAGQAQLAAVEKELAPMLKGNHPLLQAVLQMLGGSPVPVPSPGPGPSPTPVPIPEHLQLANIVSLLPVALSFAESPVVLATLRSAGVAGNVIAALLAVHAYIKSMEANAAAAT